MFEYTDPDGDRLTIARDRNEDGKPILCFTITSSDEDLTVYVAAGRTEEVVAGIREETRQTGAQAPARSAS
ncbi:hypothetical protein [Streptomyces sp. NPDC059928]|uniref:hypothetical protein n=1 Tax=unclassified Streptomyces TaxID=2593676 RepID=UPI0036631DE3